MFGIKHLLVSRRVIRILLTQRHSKINFDNSPPSFLELVSVLAAHSILAPNYKVWSTMCLWYAGSCTDILKGMFDGREEICSPQLWGYGDKFKVLPLRKALYKPYDATEVELCAAVSEVEGEGKRDTKQVVANLRSLSKENLIARAAALKKETEDVLCAAESQHH